MPGVLMRAPNGRTYRVPEANIEKARARGLEFLESPASAGEQAGAALSGAARGLTVGLSDVVLPAIGAVSRQELADVRAAAPAAATVGEMAGAIGGAFVPGSPVARVGQMGRAAEAAALARGAPAIAARAAGGAAEGGIWGLGAAISESQLGDDPELSAQKLLAGAGGGAFVGGALTVAAGAVGAGGSALMRRFGGRSLRDSLEKLSHNLTVRQIAQKNDLAKFNLEGRIPEVGEYMLRKLPVTAGDTAETVYQKAVAASTRHGDEIGQVLADVDARALGVDTARIRAQFTPELKKLSKSVSRRPVFEKLTQMLDDYDARPRTFMEMWDEQAALRQQVGHGQPLNHMKQEIWKLRKVMRDQLVEQAGEVSPHFGKVLAAASRDYGSAEQVERLARQTLRGQIGNRFFGMSDTQVGQAAGLAGAVLTGDVSGLGLGLVAAVGNKLLRERGGFIAGVAADRLARSSAVPRIAEAFRALMSARLATNPGIFGAFRPVLETAAARGALDLLATHVRLAQTDPNYLPTMGMLPETPEAVDEYAHKQDQLGQIAAQIAAQDARLDVAIKRFFGQQGGPRPKRERTTERRKDFEERARRLAEVVTNPEAAKLLVPEGFESTAPALAVAFGVSSRAAVQLLHDKAPKPPNAGQMKALTRPWAPSDADLDRFYRYVEAVSDPMGVVEALGAGQATPEGIETLQLIYPKLLNDLQQRMIGRLAEWEKPLDYRRRQALELLFGPEFVGGHPGQGALMQQTHRASMIAQARPASVDGRQQVSQEHNLETQAQRIEAR